MNIQELKKLRAQTGASLSECKRALEEGSNFEGAIELACQFVAEREKGEQEGEQALEQKRRESYRAEQERISFIATVNEEFGLYPHEVEELLKETDGDREATRVRARLVFESKRKERLAKEAKRENESNWSMTSSFRSSLLLSGSSEVKIWFECVQDARIRFRLDMATGLMTRLQDWHPHLLMPGEDPNDTEPLSVWGIDSSDDRINISMHVDCMDDLFVEGKGADESDHPEVSAILKELTNLAVRDMWIEK